jgi:A/G-specific adenine glycosylase
LPDLADITVHSSTRDAVRRRLLDWYAQSHRDLPWRKTDDPYRILLSEFMLQQTQVATVIPYYHRFIDRFPTLPDLARSPQADVLKMWEGLGYYARARNLHRAAGVVTDTYGGEVPRSYDDLASLPGFGPYTTAAVLSIAFGQDYAVVDGNVIRVLSRLFDISDEVRGPSMRPELQKLAQHLLPPGHAGAYNQAVMELGALVCRPAAPLCRKCPLQSVCRSKRANTVIDRPVRKARSPIPHHTYSVGLVWRNGRVLLVRRPQTGLLGGLWEFPAARREASEALQVCCERGVRETTGVKAAVSSRHGTVRHTYSHFRVTMHAFNCTYRGGRARHLECDEVCWVEPDRLEDYAISRANRKIIETMNVNDLLSPPKRRA